MYSMRSVLDHYRIQLRQVNPQSLRGKCPLPTHTSEQSKESFGVQLEKKIWACESSSCAEARQGKKGGNVLDLVAAMEDCSIRDAAIKLNEWFVTSRGVAPHKTERTLQKEKLVAERKEESDEQVANKPLSFT